MKPPTPQASLSLFIWDPISRYLAAAANRVTSFVPPPPRRPEDPPRRVLVVHAHPLGASSFNGACFLQAKAALEEAGHSVQCMPLYEHKFQPCLTADDLRQYMQPLEKCEGTEEVKQQVELLRWCDSLVLVFPTWWYGLPAMLKGWLDRCFLPSVAFELPKEGDKPSVVGLMPRLTNINKIGVVTTCGSTFRVIRHVGDPGRRTIARGIRPLLAPECTLLWVSLYNADGADDATRKAFLEKVHAAYFEF